VADRQRQTQRINFRGMNSRLLPDALPPTKSPCAINIRAEGDSTIRTRPGYAQAFTTGSSRLTDLRAYTALGTDNKPRIIVHDSGGGVWLDDGVQKGTVGSGGTGASLIPYRPNQSPQSWMYVGNSTGYSKFSAPDASNNVTAQKVGIAEPQSPPTSCPDGRQFTDFTGVAAGWTQSLIAGAPSDATRSTDTVVAIFQDPGSVSPATKIRYSVQVGTGSTKVYQTDEMLTFAKSSGGTITAVVEDVFPPINGGTALTIQAIYYFAPGDAVIVPSQLPSGTDKPQFDADGNPLAVTTTSDLLPGQLADLRRGSLVQLGSEVVLVLNVVTGPQHQIVFEAKTVSTHAAGETIIGIPAIACSGLSSLVVGQTVTAAEIDCTFTFSAGNNIGKLSQTLGTNPFNAALGSGGTPQEDDLIHVSIKIDTPQNLTALRLVFDVGDGSFTQNLLYYEVNVNALQAVLANTSTQLNAVITAEQQLIIQRVATDINDNERRARQFSGNVPSTIPGSESSRTSVDKSLQTGVLQLGTGTSQWSELSFPIAQLTRAGTDETKTLANCTAVQVLVNCTATVVIGISSLWVGGGGQPDVGTQGSPYFYRVRPRSVTTGARGNPSPSTRAGTYNRLQPTVLTLPASYDTQIEVWDIERYGGSVFSWRLVGTALGAATTYLDNALDSAALAGELLEFDNFEPWPTVDIPWTAKVGVNGITSITVVGVAIIIQGPFTAFLTSTLRWLPGTLITLNGQLTYSLNSRPTAIAGGVLFFIAENAGNPTVTSVFVNEPLVANQPLPYLWGPDGNGVIFGCGDAFRPGFLYSAKQFMPDSSPNNPYDLTPPSEPLLGGEVVDGLPMVASSNNWWELQAAFSTPQRWNPVKTPAGRGLGAPFAHCTDGKLIYFVAKDGVYSMIPGLPAISLTEADIGNLFPHDGVPGFSFTYGSFTFSAPDYARASLFRLSIVNSFLRFHYVDNVGTYHILVLDMTLDSIGNARMAWSVDTPFAPIVASYQPEQPPGTLLGSTAAYSQCYFGDSAGIVYTEVDTTNDAGHAIAAAYATPEWDVSDERVQKQWLDVMVDSISRAAGGITVQPMSNRVSVGTLSTVAQDSRNRTVLPLGNPIADFLGVLLQWTDDFSVQTQVTYILGWSLESVAQPLLIRSWLSVPTSHGLHGYHTIYRIRFAYVSTSTVTLTITAFDGTSPAVITLPSTSGAYQKVEFVPTFNKGLLFTYQGSASASWAPILEDCEILVGAWSRSGPCAVFTGLGGVEAA